MKKHIALALCIVFALSLLPGFASAAGTVAVTIDGTPVEFTESSGSPFIDSNDARCASARNDGAKRLRGLLG
jgi:P pilus assembly chaperone PapD